MTYYRHFPQLGFKPALAFFGTDEEIAAAESTKAAYESGWRDIITAPDFVALKVGNDDRWQILSHSIRTDGAFQLSYFDQRGAIMHETYAAEKRNDYYECIHSMAELYHKLMLKSFSGMVTAEVLTA